MTEYEYKYYSVSRKWPNTNTNIIRFPKKDRIRIWISFGYPEMTKYEYKYYSATQEWPNTNTNIIRLPNNDRIQISFGFPKMIKFYKQMQILLSFPKGRPPRPVVSLTMWCWIHRVLWWLKPTTNAKSFQSIWLTPCDSGLWGLITVLAAPSTKRRTLTHSFLQRIGWPSHQKSKSAVTNFHVPIYQGLGPTHQKYQCSEKNIYSIQKKFPAVFSLRKSAEYE